MCCFTGRANLSHEPNEVSTRIFSGRVDHPIHGLINVTLYGNQIQNLAGGPNCMILLIPSADDMEEANFFYPAHIAGFLKKMSRAVFPPPPPPIYRSRLIGSLDTMRIGAAIPPARVIDVGNSKVVIATNPLGIPEALETKVPDNMRPTLKPELYEWIRVKAPGMHIVMKCFDGNTRWEDFGFWYTPLEGHTDVITFPALDAHDGGPPDLDARVRVDHELFTSWPGMEGGVSVNYSPIFSPEIQQFLPKTVAGTRATGYAINGDFGIDIGTPNRNGVIDRLAVRRVLLPGMDRTPVGV